MTKQRPPLTDEEVAHRIHQASNNPLERKQKEFRTMLRLALGNTPVPTKHLLAVERLRRILKDPALKGMAERILQEAHSKTRAHAKEYNHDVIPWSKKKNVQSLRSNKTRKFGKR